MKLPHVKSSYTREIAADSRRISGVTPAVTKAFSEQPWKYLPKAKGLRALAGGKG